MCARSARYRARGRIALTPLIFPSIEEITFRFTRSPEWDVSELSFGKYISLTSQGNAPMIAIPVFPSRVHRHSAIYVGAIAASKPQRISEGRAVAIPEWAQTAGIYVRGMLAEEEGVDLAKIKSGCRPGSTRPGASREGRAQAALRHPLPGAADSSLSAMLASGEVDAGISARAPRRSFPAARWRGFIRAIVRRKSASSRRPASSRSCI
jgi:4,5-dihydroxyphthalate decarboxylase